MDQQSLMQMGMRSAKQQRNAPELSSVFDLSGDYHGGQSIRYSRKVARPAFRIETVIIGLSGLTTTTPIATTMFQQMVMLGNDFKIERVECNLTYLNSSTQDYKNRSVTGRWTMWLFQIQRDNQFVRLTNPKQVMDPRGEPFLLGSTSGRVEGGRPIYLRLDYEAATAPAGAVVFWDHADSLAMTITTS